MNPFVVLYTTKKVMCQGVRRKGMHGIPLSVVQDERKRDDHISALGTVKADVLEEDPACLDLVEPNFYVTNPVHYLSMLCKELKWQLNEKSISNVETSKTKTISSLRINIIYDYNMKRGSVYDGVHPNMSPLVPFSGMYQKLFILCRNRTN